MIRLFLILSLLCISILSSAEEVKSNILIFEECKQTDTSIPKILKQVPPRYPRLGLEKAIEANVMLEFTVDENGKVINPKVIWYDQSELNEKEYFSKNSIKAVKKFKYKPAKNELSENVTYEGLKVVIGFRLEGYENVIPIKNKVFESLIARIQRQDTTGITFEKFKNIVNDIDEELQSPELTLLEKAAFYYLKAISLKRLDAEQERIKKNLLLSKSYYSGEFIETLRNGKQVRTLASEKLNTFVGLLLIEIYFKEENWAYVEKEMAAIQKISFNTPRRFYRPYIYQGVASYTNENWCNAFQGFNRAKKLAEVYGYDFPERLKKAMEYSSLQLQK